MNHTSHLFFIGLFIPAFVLISTASCAQGDTIDTNSEDVPLGSHARGGLTPLSTEATRKEIAEVGALSDKTRDELLWGEGNHGLVLAEADRIYPMHLVTASESSELRAADAIITPVRGATPALLHGSLKLDAVDDEAQPAERMRAEQVNLTPNLFDDGAFSYSSGLSGTSYDVVVSKKCIGRTRESASAYAYDNNGGYCNVVKWYTNDPSDCRFIVHVGASAFKHGKCAWSVYANELGQFSYTASNTNSAQQNTTNASIYLASGQTLTAATCGLVGASAFGDTYLRLFDDGVLVAQNDDACGGLSSSLVYTAMSEKTYELRAGCYSSSSCSGTVVWVKQP